MPEDKLWMRVTDAGSPLCGWDLLCEKVMGEDGDVFALDVLAARRVDVMLGDRPLQFNPQNGLGMMIDPDRVELSPMQESGPFAFEIDADGLYGEHLERRSYNTQEPTPVTLDVEVFENAVLVALTTYPDDDAVSNSWFGPPNMEFLAMLEEMFEESNFDGVEAAIIGGPDGRAQA